MQVQACVVDRLCTHMWVCAHTCASTSVPAAVCLGMHTGTLVGGRVNLYTSMIEGNFGALAENRGKPSPPGRVPPTLAHILFPQRHPPCHCSPLSPIGEEESSLLCELHFTLHICVFQTGGWSTNACQPPLENERCGEKGLLGLSLLHKLLLGDTYEAGLIETRGMAPRQASPMTQCLPGTSQMLQVEDWRCPALELGVKP